MTREEFIEMLNILLDNAEIGCADITVIKHVSFDSFKFVIEKSIQALSQEPCDDVISRQDAIDAIYEHEFSNWCDKDEVSTILNDLPSVTQKSKTGHWIDADGDNAICSCCNRLNHLYGTYCKHCGAKMVEPQESEE